MNLRLLGAPTIKDIVPAMVDASNIHSHIVSVPGDSLYDSNCEHCVSCCGCLFVTDVIALVVDQDLPLAKLKEKARM